MTWGRLFVSVAVMASASVFGCCAERSGHSSDSSASTSGRSGSTGSPTSGASGGGGTPEPRDAGAVSVGVGGREAASDAGTTAAAGSSGAAGAAPSSDEALTEQANERLQHCKVAREPALLGISPWLAGAKLLVEADGLQLLRAEGGMPGTQSTGERLVVSKVSVDGTLGPANTLAEQSAAGSVAEMGGAIHQLLDPRRNGGQAWACYVLHTQSSPNRFFARSLGGDTTVELSKGAANYLLPLVVDEGFLTVAGVYDEVHTDSAKIWSQALDAQGKPSVDPIMIFESSATQRTANLSALAAVPTSAGFLVLYAWFDATASAVDISHYRFRFQALDTTGRPVGAPQALEPEVGSHIIGNPQLRTHRGETLLLWQEAEYEPDSGNPTGHSANPSWSVVRVARLDERGAIQGRARSVIPPGGPKLVSGYWADLGDDAIGVGWYVGETDFGLCPQCWPMGTNYIALLADDLQSLLSNVVELRWDTADAGFIATQVGRSGEELLVVGDLAHNRWQEAAFAAVSCK